MDAAVDVIEENENEDFLEANEGNIQSDIEDEDEEDEDEEETPDIVAIKASLSLQEKIPECSICKGPIQELYIVSPCGHQFCKVCITRAKAVKNECPNCRGRMVYVHKPISPNKKTRGEWLREQEQEAEFRRNHQEEMEAEEAEEQRRQAEEQRRQQAAAADTDIEDSDEGRCTFKFIIMFLLQYLCH